MYQIVAFDLDGTLADTIPMCLRAFRISVSPYADHELSEENILHTFGLNEIGMIKAAAGRNWKLAVEDFYTQYELLHREVTDIFPGIAELLHFLKKKEVIIALITGKGEKSCAITLEKLGLSEMFDEQLYGSETSPNKKEHMEYFLNKYSVPKENFCYIGDAVQDIKACRAAGVVCFSAAWQESARRDVLEKENPGRAFGSAGDLLEYLKYGW